MTIKKLKNTFHLELHSIYPKKEIDSFSTLLLNDRMQLKRIDIALNPNLEISSADSDYFSNAIKKLKKEIPIQYIIGHTEFYGIKFYVNKNVLIPRPETEELIAWTLENAKEKRENKNDDSIKILDIGTGSGCIAIALAKNLPSSKIWALDISNKALNTAKKNAELNHVDIQFLEKNILEMENLPLKFDIIVSNPPYIRELEKQEIKNNVLNNEPHLALFVKDTNPLIFYNKIIEFSKKHLNQKGQLFFEINQYLGTETVALLAKKNFQNIELKKDIFGNHRMIRSTLN